MLCPSGAESDPGRGTATAATTKQTSFSQRSRFPSLLNYESVCQWYSTWSTNSCNQAISYIYCTQCSIPTPYNKYVLLIVLLKERLYCTQSLGPKYTLDYLDVPDAWYKKYVTFSVPGWWFGGSWTGSLPVPTSDFAISALVMTFALGYMISCFFRANKILVGICDKTSDM